MAVRGEADQPYVASLREWLGLVGAFEWRRKGVWIPALEARIHPHYGVFSPVRGEYVALVARRRYRRCSAIAAWPSMWGRDGRAGRRSWAAVALRGWWPRIWTNGRWFVRARTSRVWGSARG